MVVIKENIKKEIDSIFDDITSEIDFIRVMVETGASKEELLEELRKFEEALA